ncbi:NF-kappa-B-repressing factor-like [Branchiostoma lanceolatum]|uniref:NF-kappa-B-repressing factor-like n=1 Tax=Branchiostoma lanceolatum TaxID=7740 RepID=UPI0034560D4A
MAAVEKHLDETVRDQWESPVQWDARKKFILHNWDQHPEDQLVCLSNVWANMEFLGCRYNAVVEQRVKEMAAGMPEFQKPELPQSTADEQDDKRNRNDGGGYGGKRDLKAPGDPPHKRLKHIDLKKMINFKSGGVLGEEGKKGEEQPPIKQETEGGSFAAPTFSVQPSTSSASCSSMFSRDEEQQKRDPGSKAESSTISVTKPAPSVKPHTLSTNTKPSILPENRVLKSLLLRKKRFFNSLSEAIRSRYAELSRATENHVHVFTQCVQQCRANPLYNIVEVTSSSKFLLETDRVDVPGFACDLYVEGVYLARGYGKGKVGAKTSAVKKALDRLRHHRSVVVATRIDSETGNVREEYVTETGKPVPLPPTLPRDSSQGPSINTTKTKTGAWEPRFAYNKSLSDFVILENAENAICILNSSAQFSKMNVTFDVNKNWRNGTAMHQCVVRINQTFVADAWSTNSKDVKHLAAEAALSKLRQTNPIVKPKKAELTEDALTRTEMFGSKGAGEEQIKETNIGNKMLRKMGWSGGGIGKEGREGIAEPIKVNVMERRAGLGTATDLAEKQLISAKEAHQVILNYVQSGREDDLVFSPELTSDERAAIHKMARRYNLQHKSYGKGKKRYLVIMRKRSAQDVIAQAQFRPGQYGTVVGDGKYEVNLPQSSSWQ